MPVITYQAVPELISARSKKDPSASLAPVCLLFGEELLYKSAHVKLLASLLPKGADDPSHESFSGDAAGVLDAIERVSTYALLGTARVVTISDFTAFHTRKDSRSFAEKVAKSVAKDQMGKAANQFLKWLTVLGLGVSDLVEGDAKERQRLLGTTAQEDLWMEKVLHFCRDKNLSPSAPTDVKGLLENTVSKGLPSGNHLMITTEVIDKRRRLYKLLAEQGLVIDCSVPGGQRHADRQVQKAVLQEQAQRILDGTGKTLSPNAFSALYDRTGFDLRLFSISLEKVLAFVGDRTHIKSEDVGQVLIRTKEDPIFEFTNALSQRNLPKALFYFKSLLNGDFHALQLLSAMTNLVRRLLAAQGFIKANAGVAWNSNMPFNQFKTQVLPVVRHHDQQLQERLNAWNNALRDQAADGPSDKPKKKTKRKAKATSTLFLSTQSASPYPLYQTFISQDRFSDGELEQALGDLQRCDILIKRGSQQPGLLLERVTMTICTLRGRKQPAGAQSPGEPLPGRGR